MNLKKYRMNIKQKKQVSQESQIKYKIKYMKFNLKYKN